MGRRLLGMMRRHRQYTNQRCHGGQRQKAGEHVFQALSKHLDPVFAASKFALSFDMQINDKDTSWKRNNIHDALKVEAAHG